jgi:uncharacterized RDD family membrane protein YckC
MAQTSPAGPVEGPSNRSSVASRLAGATGLERAIAGVVEETIVRTVESDAVINALERIIDDGRLQAAVERSIDGDRIELAVKRAIESQVADRVWEDILASDKAQMLVERIAEAPEVRAAVAAQGFGLITDLGRQVGRITMKVDEVLDRVTRTLLRRPQRSEPTDRAGLLTRAAAFGVDGGLLSGAFALFSSLVTTIVPGDSGHLPWLAIAGISLAVFLGAGIYLASFWALEGQTPGMRFLGLRLEVDGNPRIGARRAVKRLFGLVLAILPLGLGLARILVSERRRGLQDVVAGTEVVRDKEHRYAPWAVNDIPGEPG